MTSGIEHKAVLGACGRLEREGFRVFEVPATGGGVVDLDVLAGVLDERTAVVAVMLVNNETGVRQPVDEIARLVRDIAPRAVVHTDAVQAPQWLDLAAARAPKHNREYFLRLRDAVAAKMTRAQLDLGQQLALEWSMLRTGRRP